MTGTSLTTQGNAAHLRDGRPPTLPTSVRAQLEGGYGGEWKSITCLARIKADGFDSQIPYLAERWLAACRPMARDRLVQRLTALGMVMSPNRPAAEATMWVHETARLLGDLAEDVVCDALDDYQRTNKFLPTVAEIRERADPAMERRRRDASRLDAMARLIASGAPIPDAPKPVIAEPKPAEPPCTPEQAAAILAEMGLKTSTGEKIMRHVGKPRMPTRADYIAMGVDPATLRDAA